MDLLRDQNGTQTGQNQPPQQRSFIGKLFNHWAVMDAMPPKQRAIHRFKGVSACMVAFVLLGLIATIVSGEFHLSTIPSAIGAFIMGEAFIGAAIWASYMASK